MKSLLKAKTKRDKKYNLIVVSMLLYVKETWTIIKNLKEHFSNRIDFLRIH